MTCGGSHTNFVYDRFRCAQMDLLISQVMKAYSNNSALKQKVLELLNVMRQPALPDIAFIFRAIGRKRPGKTMRAKNPVRSQ
jgi:hypothetical protein